MIPVKIYGCSDDLVEIENSQYKENEIGCYDSDVRIVFTDGTQIRIGYPKEGKAIWWIEIEKCGTALYELHGCDDEDATPYSDVFLINAEVKRHSVINQKYKRE